MDSPTPQAGAAPDRLLWFYRTTCVGNRATVFLSPTVSDVPQSLWLRAAESVAKQRARWCEGAECNGVSLFIGVNEQGTRTISVVARAGAGATKGCCRLSLPNLAFVEGVWRILAGSASTEPIGALGQMFRVSGPPRDADCAAPGECADDGGHPTLAREAIPCDAVWCAWCRGDEVVAAGRAYSDEPEALKFPGLAFSLWLGSMAVMPMDEEDAVAIRAGLDKAIGPGLWGLWCAQNKPAASAPLETHAQFACAVCFDRVCRAHARAIDVALPLYPEPRTNRSGVFIRFA